MLQGAIAGLAAGGLYAVLGVCLTLMSRLVRVVNFAQAATGMFGAFTAVWFVREIGLPIWLGSILGVLVAGVLAAAIGFIAATWLSEASTTTRSAMTVGPLLLLISLSFILFGNKPQPFTPIIAGASSMQYRTFVRSNIIGGTLWAFGVTMLGYWVGQVDAIANHIELAIVAVIAVSLLPAVVEVLKHRRAGRRPAQQ